jgi:hypothetical protein
MHCEVVVEMWMMSLMIGRALRRLATAAPHSA